MFEKLFSEQVPSSKTFDKKAKKIIRNHYKLITDNSKPPIENQKFNQTRSEIKDYSARTAFTAAGLGAENIATNDTDHYKTGGLYTSENADKSISKKIENYYQGEGDEGYNSGMYLYNQTYTK